MYKLTKTVSVLIISFMFVVLPSINMNSMMNGTQSGKTFIFLYLIIAVSIPILIENLFFYKTRYFRINILDVLLIIWCLYVILNCYIREVPSSLRSGEFYGLIFLYIALRQIHNQYFIWLYFALVIGGTVQAIYGNLQLWGYFPSHHGLFKMTGSFFNPGPYAGYLAAIFPISLGLYLFNSLFIPLKTHSLHSTLNSAINPIKSFFVKFYRTHFFYNNNEEKSSQKKPKSRIRFTDYITIKSIFLISIISICLVLPASRSRAAWLAVVVSSFYLYSVKFKLLQKAKIYFNTKLRKYSLLLFTLLLLTSVSFGLYYFKKGSADGRLLIWKVSTEMIKEKPVFGYGYDGFKKHYMDYQAEHFKDYSDSKQAMVAGDTNYAFNELIQATVEYGITGLLVIIALIFFIFFSENEISELEGVKAERICRESEQKPFSEVELEWGLLHISRAVILSILVFGLFSYPSQILPIKICLIGAIACVANIISLRIDNTSPISIHLNKSLLLAIRSVVSIGILGLLWLSFSLIRLQEKAYADWKNAFDLYNMGLYNECLADYEKAYPILKANGDFLTNYGKALSMAEKYEEAITVLTRASQYYPNIVVYTALGDSYRKLKQPEQAEQAYLHAWNMNPSRFYPKYLLAKLYEETGQKEKAKEVAKELLSKDVKIKSTAIQEIREEMKKIIEKSDAETRNENKIRTNNNLCPDYTKTKEGAHCSVVRTGKFMLQKW